MSSVTTFGPYELQELLGRGGMGEVYRAFDRDQHRVVALKLLPMFLAADAGFAERFKRESYLAARLNDPHVIPIHRSGEIDGRLYIDMRLVNGTDLAQIIDRDGPLPLRWAVQIITQAAEALDAAHAENLIHRDVKPSNLLITPRDFVYLVDFGIAHVIEVVATEKALTASGATIGTPDYMAPERFLGGNDVGARADVYSLACVLYECLTGQRPFVVDGLPALMHAHLSTAPPAVTDARPELPPSLDHIIARGMAKDPAKRYATAGEFAAEVGRTLHEWGPSRAPMTMSAVGTPQVPAMPAMPVMPAAHEFTPEALKDDPRLAATPPAPRPSRRSRQAVGWLASGLTLVAVAVLLVVLVGRVSPGTNTDVPENPAQPTAEPTSEPAAGDLGLSTPISNPPCTGQYVTFVGAAVTPGAYQSEVAQLLASYPGSSYLLSELSCPSLRARSADEGSIYAVYLGPFTSQREACAARDLAGGDSYVKILDELSPPEQQQQC